MKTGNVWIISEGRYTDADSAGIDASGSTVRHVREYRISQLARYMLDPRPLEVKKHLVGCEIHWAGAGADGIGGRIRQWLAKGKGQKSQTSGGGRPPDILLSNRQPRRPALSDPALEKHLARIDEMLRPYDPARKRLADLKPEQLSDIVGICEDFGGNRSLLNLQGTLADKINYMTDGLDRQVGVLLDRAMVSGGLYEMGGFDFAAFDPEVSYRLIRFRQNNDLCWQVADDRGHIDFKADAPEQLHHLQLLQQSLADDTKLVEPFRLCMEGAAVPLKIFFNNQLRIDYSKAHIPALYREVLGNHPMETTGKQALIQVLKAMQLGIAFTYVPTSASGDEKLFTNLSVMHDLKALDPIRETMPGIYSEIHKRAGLSEAGRYYLLDSIKGYRDDIGLQAK